MDSKENVLSEDKDKTIGEKTVERKRLSHRFRIPAVQRIRLSAPPRGRFR